MRQSSEYPNDAPIQMNTEEVYRSLHKTTAEIQNYSFETKLGRDTNSKDSGISQMDEQPLTATSNELIRQQQIFATNQSQVCGVNGHNGNDKEDSCNGSKTQSATTTESNTPENTIRIEGDVSTRNSFTAKHSNNVKFSSNGELVTECECDPLNSFSKKCQRNNKFSGGAKEPDIIKEALSLTISLPHEHIIQTLADLSTCIKLGNCELPIKHFK